MTVTPIFISGARVGFDCTGGLHLHRSRVAAWLCGAWRWVTGRRAM